MPSLLLLAAETSESLGPWDALVIISPLLLLGWLIWCLTRD